MGFCYWQISISVDHNAKHHEGNKALYTPMQSQFTNAYIDGLVQDCSNSSALAMELLQFCTKPSICGTRPRNFTVEIYI